MRTVLAALLAIATCVVHVHSARASDFWDEVRTPGLRAWKQDVAEAREALRARRFADALVHADRAIRRVPDRPFAHVLRALILAEMSRGAEAVTGLETALDLDPAALDDVEHGSSAARVAAVAGAYELSARILARVLGRMGSTELRRQLYVLYGDVLLTLGPDHLSSSIVAYREAFRGSYVNDVRAGLGLALALRRQGELLEADGLARQVVWSRVPRALTDIPVPETERAARRAIALEALSDLAGARKAWAAAREGATWQSHANAELARLNRVRAPTNRGTRNDAPR